MSIAQQCAGCCTCRDPTSPFYNQGGGTVSRTGAETTAEMVARARAQANAAPVDVFVTFFASGHARFSVAANSCVVINLRYRIRFFLPKVGTGRNYRATWVERFLPVGGTGITSVEVTRRGRYRPDVTITGGGGTGARAVAIMSPTGTVTALRILVPGSGYTSAPTVAIEAAINGGTSSTGWVAVVSSGQVSSIGGGTPGDFLPTVSFNGGLGAGAAATCTMDPDGGVEGVTITNAGSGYDNTARVVLQSPVSGAAAMIALLHYGTETTRCAVWDGSTLSGRWVVREVLDAGHAIDSIEVLHGGEGFVSPPPITIINTGGEGTGLTATASVSGGAISAITVTDGGSGYTIAPRITVSGAFGRVFLATAHFGTETEYLDGLQPVGALPVGFETGGAEGILHFGDTGTLPFQYYEIPAPVQEGTIWVANVRGFCDGSTCP